MADASKQCTITNASGNDIVVALAVGSAETGSPGAVTAPNGELEVLKTTAGSTVIKKDTAGTVTLDHNYKPGANGNRYLQHYDLVVSDSNWLCPLASLPVSRQDSGGTAGYAPQTVAKGDRTAMSQAVAFYQTVAAYPGSGLAKDYLAALAAAKEAAKAKADGSAGSAAAVADAISDSLAAFFKGTAAYGQVTLADVVAVDSYYKAFPAVWAQYKDTLTYYLYSSDGKTAGFAGTLSLQKSGPVDVTKAAGGYTCRFAPALAPADTGKTDVDEQKAVSLTYADGLFVDDPAAAKPQIALKGAFLLQRRFTDNPDDTGIITAVIGKVAGQPAIGFDAPQTGKPSLQAANRLALTSTDWNSFWNTVIHPKTQNDIIKSAAVFIGIAAAIPVTGAILYGIYKLLKSIGTAISREGFDSRVNILTEDEGSGSDLVFGKYSDGPNPEWEKIDFDEIRKEDELFENNLAKGKLLDGLQKQHDSLETMLEFYNELPANDYVLLQEALGGIKTSTQTLQNATNENLASVVKSELTDLTARQTVLDGVLKRVKATLSNEAVAAAENSLGLSSKTITELTEEGKSEEKEAIEDDPRVKNLIDLSFDM